MNNESRREDIVKRAVQAADAIIMDESNGTLEETNMLTSAVALAFLQKVHGANASALLRSEITQ